MGKKKKGAGRRNGKPLMVEKGIAHLQSSFIAPTTSESTVLSTVVPDNPYYGYHREDSDVCISNEESTNLNDQTTEFYQSLVQTDADSGALPLSTPQPEQQDMLQNYWQIVDNDPYNFEAWMHLLDLVENMKDVNGCRKAFNTFLPLFPYCYAYWLRYSTIEKENGSVEQAQKVLQRGLEAFPLSTDLWLAYIDLCEDEEDAIRLRYEASIQAAGKQFTSDCLWEAYIKWESENGRHDKVTKLYERLIQIPTQLYNRHWDDFVAHVRDRESAEEIKEQTVAKMIPLHETCDAEVNKRWNYECKIKRPYFHIKALDQKQLNNWMAYLDFEIGEQNHDRVVLLFERCLVSCAKYEQFWCKYANYLETTCRSRQNFISVKVLGTESAKCDALGGDSPLKGSDELPAKEDSLSLPQCFSPSGGAVAETNVDDIRSVYKRACQIHCVNKPSLRLHWALYEEETGELDAARDLIQQATQQCPDLLRGHLQLIDLERRCENLFRARELFEECLKTFADQEVLSFLTIKYARFLFKVMNEGDVALSVLRTALKKDRCNIHLYSQVVDICYQRRPVDIVGFNAAIQLIVKSKDLDIQTKLDFVRKKCSFAEEFGDIASYQQAKEQLSEIERLAQSTVPQQPHSLPNEVMATSEQIQEFYELPLFAQLPTAEQAYHSVAPAWTVNMDIRKCPEVQQIEMQQHEVYQKLMMQEHPHKDEKTYNEYIIPSKRQKLDGHVTDPVTCLPAFVNIPEWFVHNGGEFCIGETSRGPSMLRYWPCFLSGDDSKMCFASIRRKVKWHQRQINVSGKWKNQQRLVSWIGPCDYSYSGITMIKNDKWPVELLDLLHRLIAETGHNFNSCFLNLYRTGHDSVSWHSDDHSALGNFPPVASLSLGVIRFFELKSKHNPQNFMRFPLFPGSLLLMEGATQTDWLHQVPKDPSVKEERINLTFRIMFTDKE